MAANPDGCTRLKQALGSSLDILGESSKQALLYYLQERCNISIQDGGRCFSLEEVEAALHALLGAGSLMIMDMVEKELGIADNGGAWLACPSAWHKSHLNCAMYRELLGTRLPAVAPVVPKVVPLVPLVPDHGSGAKNDAFSVSFWYHWYQKMAPVVPTL